MFKKLIISSAIILSVSGFIYAGNMGMGLDMGMSTGGGAGGAFPSACGAGYSQLVGADASDIMDSTGGNICVPD